VERCDTAFTCGGRGLLGERFARPFLDRESVQVTQSSAESLAGLPSRSVTVDPKVLKQLLIGRASSSTRYWGCPSMSETVVVATSMPRVW